MVGIRRAPLVETSFRVVVWSEEGEGRKDRRKKQRRYRSLKGKRRERDDRVVIYASTTGSGRSVGKYTGRREHGAGGGGTCEHVKVLLAGLVDVDHCGVARYPCHSLVVLTTDNMGQID